jgi:small conductance mechanosensitive channel
MTAFLSGVVKIIVFMFAVLIALDKFGITISPFIATLSAMIFGASFALQAPLSNYAAGLTIIFTRPFVVGNTITIKGYNGVVEEVKLPSTILSTGDGEKITIPNKDIVGEVIINSMENKVTETTIGISYGDDPEAAIRLIRKTLTQFPQILKTPEPQIGVDNFGDSSILIGVRYWAPTKLQLVTKHAANLAIYYALKQAKITIPFPQREVRLLQKDSVS